MSLTMSGQPQIPTLLDLDITNFRIAKEAVPEIGGVVEILDTNEVFTLQLDFRGEGSQWENMCNVGLKYEIHFDAEGIGPWPHNDRHLGTTTGQLVPGKLAYSVQYSVPGGISNEGVYRLSSMLTFQNWKGVLGFAEGLVIQVSSLEE
jgi:hypothetical protein